MLGRMAEEPKPRWWSARRAQNLKPATYRCPLCGRHLPAISDHMLLSPEGDRTRRRHAHTECVLAARRAGRLPTRDEWLKTQPRDGYRSRLTDYLNSSERAFLALTDVELVPFDGGEAERRPFLAVSVSHVVLAMPLDGEAVA